MVKLNFKVKWLAFLNSHSLGIISRQFRFASLKVGILSFCESAKTRAINLLLKGFDLRLIQERLDQSSYFNGLISSKTIIVRNLDSFGAGGNLQNNKIDRFFLSS